MTSTTPNVICVALNKQHWSHKCGCQYIHYNSAPYTQVHMHAFQELRNKTQRNTTQRRKKESPFLPPSRAGEKLEAGIFKPLIASSSSRGMKARGRDLQVPVSANWTQTTGTTQQNTTQHNAKKKERKPLFASFSSRGKARGRDLQAPDCLLLEPGYESSRQGSSSAGIGELDTNNNTSNKAWIQRLFRFPQ